MGDLILFLKSERGKRFHTASAQSGSPSKRSSGPKADAGQATLQSEAANSSQLLTALRIRLCSGSSCTSSLKSSGQLHRVTTFLHIFRVCAPTPPPDDQNDDGSHRTQREVHQNHQKRELKIRCRMRHGFPGQSTGAACPTTAMVAHRNFSRSRDRHWLENTPPAQLARLCDGSRNPWPWLMPRLA